MHKERIVSIGLASVAALALIVTPMQLSAASDGMDDWKQAQLEEKYGSNTEEEVARLEKKYGSQKNESSGGGSSSSGGGSSSSGTTTPVGSAISFVTMGGYRVITSTPGVYAANSVGGVAITTEIERMNSILDVGEGERAYAEILDSECGEVAKGLLEGAALSKGWATGPILDINIGKKNASGNIEYPDRLSSSVLIAISAPTDMKILPGYELAAICLTPDGRMEVLPESFGGYEGQLRIATVRPNGVYMMVQVPEKSLDSLHFERDERGYDAVTGLE